MFDVAKRRQALRAIQRDISPQAYCLYGPSVSAVAAWGPDVKNLGANIGHGYGDRLARHVTARRSRSRGASLRVR